MTRFDNPPLMWVTDRNQSDSPLPELAGPASAGGVDMIQIRERGLDRIPLELVVRAIQHVTSPDCQVVVNSGVDLARKFGTGVHLPEGGTSIQKVREALGQGALIGRSVHSPQSAAASEGADYLIAGHVFATDSKPGMPPIGLDGFKEIVANAPAPVLAIGGITPAHVRDIIAVGAVGVAVLSPFTRIETIRAEAAAYRLALENAMVESENLLVVAHINGKSVELPSGTTLSAFLAGRELHERLVVVERNGEIVKRDTFPDVVIEEGDLLEIVHFVGGG